MQTPEAESFLKRLATPGVALADAIKPSLDDEAALRRLFATDREHARLQNPHVGLVDIFGSNTDSIRKIHARTVKDEDDLVQRYIFPLSEEARRKDGQLAMAETLADFRSRWNIFSEGALSSLDDWSNIIAAGGSVLACVLPLPDKILSQGSKRAIRKYYHTEAYPASDVDIFMYGLTPEKASFFFCNPHA